MKPDHSARGSAIDHAPAPPRAPRADHRELGRAMEIFATDPLAGAGLPLWLPAGAVIRAELERLAKDLAHADGCVDVYSPVLGKRALFERSGHLAKFADDMFPSMSLGEEEVMLRPANCPHHALIYAATRHSYRELPIRLNELAPMFRAERSGVLSGLTRVRQISLDDTHVFCRPDQVGAEAARALQSALRAQSILGLPVDHVRLSLRDDGDGWLGTAEQWEAAQAALSRAAGEVLADHDVELVAVAGEAAFYGPKLDLQVRDDRGREESIATVQLDFNQPERFDLTYDGPDGERHRVVMIHRGTVGSMERVTASLLERYRGRLPLWLSPVQVAILPVGDAQDGQAHALRDELAGRGLRVRIVPEGSLGARIRRSRERRDAIIAVVGPAEAARGAVQVTDVAAGFQGLVPVPELCAVLADARDRRLAVVPWRSASPDAGGT